MIPHPPPEAAQLNLKPFLPWEAITLFLNWPYRCAAEPSSGNQCPEGLPVRNGFTTELSLLFLPQFPPLLLPLKTVWTLTPCFVFPIGPLALEFLVVHEEWLLSTRLLLTSNMNMAQVGLNRGKALHLRLHSSLLG